MESSEDDKKCSDAKMEGDKDLRTLECLRGRLLAERQASRIAKEDSERMENKLVKLENMLKLEIKLRNKAEKKLKFLKKKLESLDISSISVESDQSSTSEKSEVSFRSSSTTSSACCASEETESDCKITNSMTSQESSPDKQNHDQSPHNGTSASSSSSSNSTQDFSDNPSSKSEEDYSKTGHDDNSSAELRSSVEKNETDHEDCVDNSLALVPVSLPGSSVANTKTTELKPIHENVTQVLDSLRYIRETIQSSMERRRMVRVGPT